MEPIHKAAQAGDLAEVDRLVAEDGRRLNARTRDRPSGFRGRRTPGGHTPLMLAARRGYNAAAVVKRLLELGADVGLRDARGETAVHWVCCPFQSYTLALLLDAGASPNARTNQGVTPLMWAASGEATECVQLLVAHGADVDAQDETGQTALHFAASGQVDNEYEEIVRLLVFLGADPTIRDNDGDTPLDIARGRFRVQSIPVLEAAMAEPQRPRRLLKARTLLDAAHAVEKARSGEAHSTRGAEHRAAVAAAPTYLKGRVEQGQQLPRVGVVPPKRQAGTVKLVACLKYALGLEGGGGWHEEGQEPPPPGMVKEVFVELMEMMVPKWDRPNV